MYITKSDFQNKWLFCSCGMSLLLVETWCQECSYGPNKNAQHGRISGRRTAERQPSGSREDRISQLKMPAPLDFKAINLADSWKKWRQEVELQMDKRRESDERREKSENNRRENESPVHNANCKETKRCKY